MSKNLFFKVFLAFIVLIGTSACENEPLEGDFGNGSLPGGTANFQVDIDGVTFTADHANAQTANGTTMVAGTTNSGEVVQLVFSGSGTGTFSLVGNEGVGGMANYTQAGNMDPNNLYTTAFPGMTGEITITNYDLQNGLISGTFSFTASRYVDPEDESAGLETLEFTNGTFSNVPLQSDVQPPENPDPQGNFEVELDSDLYVGETIQTNLNADGLVISASNGNQLFVIQVFDPAIGSFDLANQEDALVMYDVDNTDEESLAYGAISGTLNITAFDQAQGTVSGNFSGILTEMLGEAADIEMTNGVFENLTFGTEESPNTATATVDGNPFDATVYTTAYIGGKLQVEFSNDLDESIYLVFPSGVSAGTYPITTSPADYSGRYTIDTGSGTEQDFGSVAGTGEIVITSIANNILEGTFHFDAEDDAGNTVNIDQGIFTIDIN